VITKREDSVKSNAEDLMEVRTEEATSHLAGLTGKRHFRDHSSRWLRTFWTEWQLSAGQGGRPDNEIISIE